MSKDKRNSRNLKPKKTLHGEEPRSGVSNHNGFSADNQGKVRIAAMPDVYILKCANGANYVGLAQNDLEGRVSEHQLGLNPKAWTFKRRPVELVFNENYDRFDDAVSRERQIKSWSRVKKEALIAGNYEGLPDLAKRRDD